jgi:hypothetical protein
MALFEFLLVLVSIIIGLGIAELLSGTARLLRARRSVAFYWLHWLLIGGVGFAMLQIWWEAWSLRDLPEVSFLQLCLLLASPIALFLMAHLLFPAEDDMDSLREERGLRDYYLAQAPLIWGFAMAGTVVGTFLLPLTMGDTILRPENLSGFPMMALFAVLMVSKKPRVHEVVTLLVMAMLVLDTILPSRLITA